MRSAVALVVALVAAGCASTVSFDPPLPETRDGLGQTAVIAVTAIKSTDVWRPLPRDEATAAAGAALGSVMTGAYVGCDPGWTWLWAFTCPLGLGAGIAIAPIAAGGGAIVEHNVAHSEQEIAFAASNMEKALDEVKPSEDLRDLVIASAMETPDPELSAWDDSGTDLYGSLSAEGFSTLLKVQVREFSLMYKGDRDPDVSILLGASGELFRISDGRLLYRRTWRYVSEEGNYFEIALDGAKPLRGEIHAGLDALARKMFDDLFVSASPEIQVTDLKPGIPATTSVWQNQEPDKEEENGTRVLSEHLTRDQFDPDLERICLARPWAHGCDELGWSGAPTSFGGNKAGSEQQQTRTEEATGDTGNTSPRRTPCVYYGSCGTPGVFQ